MPSYLYPGVYIEEVPSGNMPIEGVSTSTVGFLGIAERGPAVPTLLTSFGDYQRIFGTYFTDPNNAQQCYLAYAVEGFFLNGGQLCYVQRVFHTDLVTTGNSASYGQASPSSALEIQAIGPGAWGNRIGYSIGPASLGVSTLFKLTIVYWTGPVPSDSANPSTADAPTVTEVFDNLSAVPTASTFYVNQINGLSNLITVKQLAAGAPAVTATAAAPPSAANPQGTAAQPNFTMLTGGSDGTSSTGAQTPITEGDFLGYAVDPANKTGLQALADKDDISILCCPDEWYFGQTITTVSGYLVEQCENLQFCFAILQSPQNAGAPGSFTPSQISDYAAYYYPWLWIVSPDTGAMILIPPGGHIAGIYARSDSNRGVQKDPANEPILAIDHLQLQINNAQQSVLNPIGINCLRYFKSQGNLVWGGRTTSSDTDWMYISVRRLFIFVEKSIRDGTQWVVFEPNVASTWAKVVRSVSDFLTGIWQQGMLAGQTKEQAYFVRCDQTTMSESDIENGRLIVVIGIAPVFPAEFVIFQIGQWDGGSSVTES